MEKKAVQQFSVNKRQDETLRMTINFKKVKITTLEKKAGLSGNKNKNTG